MHNYLLSLFSEEKTIIIPDLGALTITDESTGELMFMPYLKYDDGKLAAFIAQKEQIELFEAKARISLFVKELIIQIDAGTPFLLKKCGTFSRENDDIVFSPISLVSEVILVADVTAVVEVAEPVEVVETVEVIEIDEEKLKESAIIEPETKIVPLEIEDEVTPIVVEIPKEEIVVETVEEEIVESVVEIKAPKLKKEKSEKISSVSSANEVTAEISPKKSLRPKKTVDKPIKVVEKKAKIVRAPKEVSKTTQPRKKMMGWVAVLVVLVFGTIWVVNSSAKKDIDTVEKQTKKVTSTVSTGSTSSTTSETNEPAVVDETETIEPETIQEDESSNESIVDKPNSSIPVKTTNPLPQKPFQLLAGVYSSKDEAIKIADDLHDNKGHTVTVGNFGGKYHVSIASFESEEEANLAKERILGVMPSASVLKW